MNSNLPAVPDHLMGGCMCGTVRYEIAGEPMFSALCHCDRCRPQSGSAFSTVIIIKRSTFKIKGETAIFEDIGSSTIQKSGHTQSRPSLSPEQGPGRYLGTIDFPDIGTRQVTVAWDGPAGKGSTQFSVPVR